MVTHVDVDDDGLSLALDVWRALAETAPKRVGES
jgi:hypothetical protein